MANWLIGQVRNEAQSEDEMLQYCREIGADETAFSAAYRSVPVMAEERFEKAAHVLFEVAKQISTSAYQNVQQARFIDDRRRAEEVSRKYMEELVVINRFGREISSRLSLEDVVTTGLQELVRVFRTDCAVLFLLENDRLILKGFVSNDVQTPVSQPSVHQVEKRLCDTCVEEGKPLYCLNINVEPRFVWEECEKTGLTSVAAIPLQAGTEVMGALCLGSHGERDFSVDENFIRSLTHEITMALRNSLLFEEVRKHAMELEDKLAELKRSNEERDSLQHQLVQAQKMEAVGILSGGIAHDFNNLLQVIQGYADLLLFRTETKQKEHSIALEIKKASQRAAELTNGLLTFSRRIESKLRPVDVNHEIRELVSMLTRAIPKMIDIEVNLDEGIHTVNADPSQLQQVLMNLAVNARDSMPEGGKLLIESRNVTLNEDYCRVHFGTKPGDYVLLSVSDTGSGMDSQTRERIFDPFFTTKQVGKGTGLGLSVAYGIIKSHGGHILCHSDPGQGTAFEIFLPALIEESVTFDDIHEFELPSCHGTESVLVVDDERMLREALAETLSRFGYKVLTASNGSEGLALFREKRDEINLVVLDLIMPEMSGVKTLEHILEIDPSARVIIASGYSENGQLEKARQAGAVDTIAKPYEARQLLALMRKVLDSDSCG